MSNTLSNETDEITDNESIDSLEADSVTFDIAANTQVLLTGSSHLQNDRVTSSGQLKNGGDATLDGLELHDSSLFINAGNITDDLGVTLGVNRVDAVTVRNLAGATWTLGQNAVLASAGRSRFVNLGVLSNNAGADNTDNATLVNSGTLHIDGKLTQIGAARVSGEVEGAGEIDFKRFVLNGAHVDVETWSADATVINGHVTTSSNSVASPRFVMSAGSELDFTGTALVLGDTTTFVGQGEVDILGSASISDLTLRGSVNFVNSGQIATVSPNGTTDGVEIRVAPSGGANIQISNLASATWTDSAVGGMHILAAGYGAAAFVNSGVFVDASYGGADFDIDVVNNGVMQEAAFNTAGVGSGFGHITFERALSGAGQVQVGPGSVEVNGAAGPAQLFAFDPASVATLTLNDVQEFNASVSGFDQNGAAGDSLVVDTSNFAFEAFVNDVGGGGGSLMFSNGATETAVHLIGGYDSAKFHAAVAGSQTTITYG